MPTNCVFAVALRVPPAVPVTEPPVEVTEAPSAIPVATVPLAVASATRPAMLTTPPLMPSAVAFEV